MRYANISYENIVHFQSKGAFAEEIDKTTLNFSVTDKDEDAEKDLQFELANDDSAKSTQLSFFYVSDLMDIILEGIEINLHEMPKLLKLDKLILNSIGKGQISQEDLDDEIQKLEEFYLNFKKFRLLLGPVEILDPKKNGKSKFINFGDIPISSKYFAEWMTEKLIRKEAATYPLSKFLTDFFNTLIKNFLNDKKCFDGEISQKVRLNQAVITSYKNKDQQWDEITQGILECPSGAYSVLDVEKKWPSRLHPWAVTQPVLNIFGSRNTPVSNPGSDRETNYLTFFAGRTQPTNRMNGIRSEDEAAGIYHYLLGKSRGIVKEISLSKTDVKFLKEVRFEQEGYNGLEQLREVYDVNIKTFANVQTFPGTYIFVDPHGFAPTSTVNGEIFDLTQFGIGGYCMIIRSTHRFGSGMAETDITAKWVASIGASATTELPAPIADTGENPDGVSNSNIDCGDAAGSGAGAERAFESLTPEWLTKLTASGGELLDTVADFIEKETGYDIPLVGSEEDEAAPAP